MSAPPKAGSAERLSRDLGSALTKSGSAAEQEAAERDRRRKRRQFLKRNSSTLSTNDSTCSLSVSPASAKHPCCDADAGRLRDVDRITTLALESAARRKLKSVDRDIVRGLLDDD